jgi:hypothetical protein
MPLLLAVAIAAVLGGCGGSSGEGGRDRALIVQVARGRPIVVCDLDGTIALGGGLVKELFGGAAAGRAAPGSAVALKRLAATHSVVYLTARAELFRAESEAFLRREGYPEGPLDPVSRVALKIRRLRRLRAERPELAWGLGDRWSDAEAYGRVGMRTILIDPGAAEAVVRRRNRRETVVRSWKSVPSVIGVEAEGGGAASDG